MEKKLRILVVEDREKNIDDARNFFFGQKNVELSIATKSYEGMKIIGNENPNFFAHGANVVDGIISDIFMPESDRRCEGLETPQGINVFLVALLRGIPFVFCTDRHHHGSLQWLDTLQRNVLKGLLIGTSETGYIVKENEAIKEKKGETKNWKLAYEELIWLINRKQEVLCSHFKLLNDRCAFILKEVVNASAVEVGLKNDDLNVREVYKKYFKNWVNEVKSKLDEQINNLNLFAENLKI